MHPIAHQSPFQNRVPELYPNRVPEPFPSPEANMIHEDMIPEVKMEPPENGRIDLNFYLEQAIQSATMPCPLCKKVCSFAQRVEWRKVNS